MHKQHWHFLDIAKLRVWSNLWLKGRILFIQRLLLVRRRTRQCLLVFVDSKVEGGMAGSPKNGYCHTLHEQDYLSRLVVGTEDS